VNLRINDHHDGYLPFEFEACVPMADGSGIRISASYNRHAKTSTAPYRIFFFIDSLFVFFVYPVRYAACPLS
jgi:hypothetical protein